MRYVLDASVGLKFVLKESLADKAVKLRAEFRQGMHEFVAPDTYLAEIGHALTRAERRGIIQPSDAASIFTNIMTTAPELHSIRPLMPRAIELSSQLRIGLYDCLYAALADREGCELLTADDRLVNALRPQIAVVSLSSL